MDSIGDAVFEFPSDFEGGAVGCREDFDTIRHDRFLVSCHSSLLQVLAELTSSVAGRRPATDTYVNDKQYIKPMVSRHLLKWVGRKSYSEDAVTLHHTIVAVRQTSLQFRFSTSNPTHNKLVTSILVEASAALDGAKAVAEIMHLKQYHSPTPLLLQRSG